MQPKPANQHLPLLILLLTCFLDWMSIGLVYPMFSSMIYHEETQFFSVTASAILKGGWLGVLLAAGPLAQFISSPIVGTLSDQKGRKTLLKNTLLFMILGYLLCSLGVFVENLYFLLIGRIIVGIGTGNAAVVSAAIADISTKENKAKNFGLVSMASGVGFTLGPFIGGTLSTFGFAIPFLFSMACSLINLILVLFFFSETHHLRRTVEISFVMGLKNLKKAFRIPSLRILFLAFFFFCVGWSFYWEFIPVTWIEKYQLTTTQVGHFFAYGAAFYALSAGLLIRPIVGKFRPLPILFIALGLLALAIYPLLLHKNIEIFWFYIPIQQFLIALIFPTSQTAVSNSVSEDSQGEIMGILQSVDSFAFAISPLIAGLFVGLNTYAPIIVAASFMLLASLILLCSYRKKLFEN